MERKIYQILYLKYMCVMNCEPWCCGFVDSLGWHRCMLHHSWATTRSWATYCAPAVTPTQAQCAVRLCCIWRPEPTRLRQWNCCWARERTSTRRPRFASWFWVISMSHFEWFYSSFVLTYTMTAIRFVAICFCYLISWRNLLW